MMGTRSMYARREAASDYYVELRAKYPHITPRVAGAAEAMLITSNAELIWTPEAYFLKQANFGIKSLVALRCLKEEVSYAVTC